MNKKVFWQNIECSGREYLTLKKENSSLIGRASVLWGAKEASERLSYIFKMDEGWTIQKVNIYLHNKELNLASNGKGKWTSGGEVLVEGEGTIDIDLSVTPFSNSLPINRFSWKEGQSRTFPVLYVDGLSLEVKKLEQQYTYLGKFLHVRRFEYKCRDYRTTITVDSDGLVVNYPGVFTRK
ncbi:putative glycolipid-binding domain-containing protein [Halobacillus massiliensis]|uniref:putative glycolipid-binding domain-containing protein n=1 Tax=Halobacillus massiliensis TaxID=1926286 RepID=UPI0009E3C54F|nr:putative glycolipid-binding domain-containing protein [Halobacillus massiliensis]